MSRRGKSKRAQRPPEGATWIWHTLDLIASPAWRNRSIHCRRLIDFLEREHLQHGGNDNGSLIATYSQLEVEGISRKSIHGAIQEAERRGLIAIERGGRKGAVMNELNRFRLTYLWSRTRKDGVWSWYEPSDNWREYAPPHKTIGAQRGTVTVPKRQLRTVPKRELPSAQVIEKAESEAVPKMPPPSIFGKGAPLSDAKAGAARQGASAMLSPHTLNPDLNTLQPIASLAFKALAHLQMKTA